MADSDEIARIIVEAGVALAGTVVADPDGGGLHHAFVNATLDETGRRRPSSFLLNQLADRLLKEYGHNVTFVIVEGSENDVDATVKTLLFRRYSDLVRNSFTATDSGKSNIWIEPKRGLVEEETTEIRRSLEELFDLLSISITGVWFTNSKNVPTQTAIIKAIRIISPCDIDKISAELVLRGFEVPNVKWMNHSLDRLRKSGIIHRSVDGTYAVTMKGLGGLGTYKNRSSPDVVRALALGRRR